MKSATCVYEMEYAHTQGEKKNGFGLKMIGGPLRKRQDNHQDKSNLCLWRGIMCTMKGKSEDFWLKLIGGPPTKKTVKSQKKQLLLLMGNMSRITGASLCWCLELYHIVSVADVLSCITLSYRWCLELYHAFCCWCIELYLACRCWCFELYHAFVADVLSCIMFPLLLSWGVSLCDSGLFNIIYRGCFFPCFFELKNSFSLGFRGGEFRGGGLLT